MSKTKLIKNFLSVSIIVPVYNVEKILYSTLKGVITQDYPIKEIIIIDNNSTDSSFKEVVRFKQDYRSYSIKIVKRAKNYGLSSSYNLGAKISKGDLIVALHSDSALPTANELGKLIEPFLKDPSIIATYPLVVHTKDRWLTYNFWQKCLFGAVVDTTAHSMNGKFDCYNKNVFLSVGGYDEERFHHNMGTEDADMRFRLQKAGRIVATEARVIHLHSFEKNYSLKHWIARRKFLTISYGRMLRMHAKDMRAEVVAFFIKPFLVFLTVLGFIHFAFLIPIFLFPFIYMRKMFTSTATLKDSRVILLPFVIIFLVYYETFWMFKSLLSIEKKVIIRES